MTEEQIAELGKKFGDIRATRPLIEAMSQLPDNVMLSMIENIAANRDFLKKALEANPSPLEFIQAYLQNFDNLKPLGKFPAGAKISCKKGCAFCCHINVSIQRIEAEAIWEYCKEKGIEIDVEYLKTQMNFKDDNEHATAPNSACVFLDQDNACKIYPLRPTICRKYVVISDPANCDAKTKNKHRVVNYINYNQELYASALGSASEEELDSMARMLLKTRPDQQAQKKA